MLREMLTAIALGIVWTAGGIALLVLQALLEHA